MEWLSRLRDRPPIQRLMATHIVSTGADALVALSLAGSIFFSVSVADARPRVLLYLALTMAPFALVSPIIGPALDRARGGRRLMLVFCTAGRGVMCILMSRHMEGLLLFPEAFTLLVLQKGYAVAKGSVVPSYVDDESQLVTVNSRLSILGVIGGAVALAPGFGIVAITDKLGYNGSASLALFAGLVFFFSAFLALQLPNQRTSGGPAHEVHGAHEDARMPSIDHAWWAMAVLRGAVGFVAFLLAFALRGDGQPKWFLGVVVLGSAAGGFLGALTAPVVRRYVREEIMLGAALVVGGLACGVGVLGFLQVHVVFAATAVGWAASFGRLAFDSLVQRDAPESVRGRVFARFETRFQLAWVIGGFLSTAIAIGGRVGLGLLAATLASVGVAYLALGRKSTEATSTDRTSTGHVTSKTKGQRQSSERAELTDDQSDLDPRSRPRSAERGRTVDEPW